MKKFLALLLALTLALSLAVPAYAADTAEDEDFDWAAVGAALAQAQAAPRAAALPALAEANIRLLGQADGATVFAGFYDVAGRMLSAQVLGSAGAISPKAAPGGCTQVRFFAADAGLRPIAEPLTIYGS